MRRRRGFLAGVLVCASFLALPAAAGAVTVSESFSSPTIPLGAASTLTFTIDHPNPSTQFVEFDDTLPAGIQIVGNPTTTCGAGLPLSTGPSNIDFTDPALSDSPGCTVSAIVQGVHVGHWVDPVGVTVGLGTVNVDASVDVVAPPSIAAAFGTSLLGLGGTTPLTFTITNPNPSFSLTGVGFTDTLPDGLEVAGQASNTCGGTVTAVSGSNSVGLSGGQISPASSCTVSAPVGATATGPFTDTTTQVFSTEGGIGNTASARLTVIGAPTAAPRSPVPDNRFTHTRPRVGSGGVIEFVVKVPDPGRIDVVETAGRSRAVFARATASARRAGNVRLTIRPNARGRLAMRHAHAPRVTVTVTVGYTPRGGTRRTTRFQVQLP